MLTLLLFLLVLGLLVAVHEFGHFWTARRLGIAVEEFGFGFPPRLIGWRRGGTLYSLNVIPFGGFVRLRGEDRAASHDPQSFAAARPRTRAAIVVSGVVMNAVVASLLLSLAFALGIPAPADQTLPGARISQPRVLIAQVLADSPASTAGLKPGDRILAVAGRTVTSDEPVRDTLTTSVGQAVELSVADRAGTRAVTVTPVDVDRSGLGRIGVALENVVTARYPLHWAVANGVQATVRLSGEVVRSLGHLVRDLVVARRLSPDIAGPVGVAVLTGQARDLGFPILVQFVALLSLSLAVLNLAPFPGLDGGRLAFVMLEGIRGRALDARVERWTHTLGYVLLLALIVAVSVKDVARFDVVDRVRHLFVR